MNILKEAESLVYGDREKQYGSPLKDFTRTAKMWSAILDCDVTAEQVALCMVALKISRQLHKSKRDNLVDGAGYLATIEKLQKAQTEKLSDSALEYCQEKGSNNKKQSNLHRVANHIYGYIETWAYFNNGHKESPESRDIKIRTIKDCLSKYI